MPEHKAAVMKPGLLIATIFIRVPDFYHQLCCQPEVFGTDMISVMQLGMLIYRDVYDEDYLPETINDTE